MERSTGRGGWGTTGDSRTGDLMVKGVSVGTVDEEDRVQGLVNGLLTWRTYRDFRGYREVVVEGLDPVRW